MASRATLLFALLSCLVLISISLSIASSSPSSSIPSTNSDKVSLAFYYESLCPYCSRFFVNYLNDLVLDKELLSIVDLHLSPWGNTKILSNGTVACQHGPDECLLDTVEVCAIDTWPKLEDHFPFVYCVESSVYEGRHKEWKSCFDKLGLDPKPVLDCVSNGYGKQLELKYAAETNALQPPHRYVPWVVVDGQPLYGDYENYISYICKAYKGTTGVKACSAVSNYDNIVRREVKPQGDNNVQTHKFSHSFLDVADEQSCFNIITQSQIHKCKHIYR